LSPLPVFLLDTCSQLLKRPLGFLPVPFNGFGSEKSQRNPAGLPLPGAPSVAQLTRSPQSGRGGGHPPGGAFLGPPPPWPWGCTGRAPPPCKSNLRPGAPPTPRGPAPPKTGRDHTAVEIGKKQHPFVGVPAGPPPVCVQTIPGVLEEAGPLIPPLCPLGETPPRFPRIPPRNEVSEAGPT